MAIGKKRKKRAQEIHPDEIFIDSSNLPDFDVDRFEGRLEKPINRRIFWFVGIFFFVLAGLYLTSIWGLQISQGQAYETRSLNNTLKDTTIFPERGVITDRNGVLLAWNTPNPSSDDFPLRQYATSTGLAHVLGYVKYPQKDASGVYYDDNYQGLAGVEAFYNDMLSGTPGSKISETDALGNVVSENVIQPPVDGQNVALSVDAALNRELYDDIGALAQEKGFTGGTGALMNIKTGEVFAMTSYPEYDPNVMTAGTDKEQIAEWNLDPSEPFLDRLINGLYAPGSIVKPIVALGALNENVIDPNTKILSTGSISIPDPYDPTKLTIFKDWRPQGWVDMEQAIAVSSDVYFYEVGGGYQNQKGLGITNIDKYMAMFGLGQKVPSPFFAGAPGTVPSVAWKALNFPDDPTWRIGDTYHTAIGQYGFQVTPIQMLLAVATIANSGVMPVPTILKGGDGAVAADVGVGAIAAADSATSTATSTAIAPLGQDAMPSGWTRVPIPQADFKIVQDGMHLDVQSGIAGAVNFPELDIAAKTGTAQVGYKNEFVNSWVEGFFPYDDPQYAFIVAMEHGPDANLIGAPFVAREFLQWTADNHIDGI